MKHWLWRMGLIMTTVLAASCQSVERAGQMPSGASKAFTSSDSKVVESRGLYAESKYAEAGAALGSSSDVEAKTELLELIRRQREDYTTDGAALLAKMKKDIPDVTAADIEGWTRNGLLQSRVIDGKTMYFNREPVNLYRFGEDAKKRRDAHAKKKPAPDWKLTEHLARIVAEAERTGKTEVLPVKHVCEFSITLDGGIPGVKKGSLVRAWLPFPQEYRQQREVQLISTKPATAFAAPSFNEKTGTGAPQRSIYFEKRVEDPSQPITFSEKFEFECYGYYPRIRDEDVRPLSEGFPREFIAERPPHIVFTPEVKKLVAEIVGAEANPLRKARKIFYWVDENIRYASEEEYCTIPSLSLKALRTGKGDCGVQAMTFIALCRAAGVPARWQSCWETKPSDSSMHDWTEIYVEPWGWIPCDPSYGVQKNPEKGHEKEPHPDPRVRDFYFGHQDSYRLIANLDYGSALVPPMESTLRSEPADFQRGEVEIDGKNIYFDHWDYNMSFTTEPKGR